MPPFSPSDFNRFAQRAGKDINAPVNEGGHTLLHVAAQSGDIAVMARLLKLGANVHQRDVNGQTPLYAALGAQDLEAVKLLLENGARFNDEDGTRTTPLHWAIEKKAEVAFLEQLRGLGVRLDTANSEGRTALHAAAGGDNAEVLTWLLNNRAVVDTTDNSNKTPLHVATERGALGAMRLLLENGADPLLRTSDIKTSLHLAAERGNGAAADILLERPAVRQTLNDYRTFNQGFTPLMSAVSNGHVAVAEKLLDVGAYINDKDHKNRHSLFIAVETGTPEMIKMLIRRGADVAKASPHLDNGQTMVHRVGGATYREKLVLLIDAGADINARDSYGGTALNASAESYDAEKARVLLELGANPDIPNNAGRRPLDRALELSTYYEEAFKIVTALLASGANPDLAPDERVFAAPLHTAARSGSVKAAKLLLDYGATVDVLDRYQGASAWLLAAGAPSFEICEMLRERGADPMVRDKSGRGILHYAAKSGEQRLLEAALKNPEVKAQVNVPDAVGATPLLDATRSYKPECVRTLLAADADPLVADTAGMTVLHQIARYANETMFLLLAAAMNKKGGNWNVQTYHEKLSPLHIAAREGNGTLDLLLKQDVDLSLTEYRGQTPLMMAVIGEKTAAVRAIAEAMKKKKISVDAVRDGAGFTALHFAVSSSYSAMMNVTALLDMGADANLRTNAGDTALHIAVTRGRADIVQTLLTRGADITLENKTGATALDVALATNRQDIVTVLQAANAALQKKRAQQSPPRFSNHRRPPAA